MSGEHGLERAGLLERAGWLQPLKPPQKHGDMSWGDSEPGQDSRGTGEGSRARRERKKEDSAGRSLWGVMGAWGGRDQFPAVVGGGWSLVT